jgi:hypothetical protein
MEIVGSPKEFAVTTQVADWSGVTTYLRDTLIFAGLTFAASPSISARLWGTRTRTSRAKSPGFAFGLLRAHVI